jgi:hypothetical protein
MKEDFINATICIQTMKEQFVSVRKRSSQPRKGAMWLHGRPGWLYPEHMGPDGLHLGQCTLRGKRTNTTLFPKKRREVRVKFYRWDLKGYINKTKFLSSLLLGILLKAYFDFVNILAAPIWVFQNPLVTSFDESLQFVAHHMFNRQTLDHLWTLMRELI